MGKLLIMAGVVLVVIGCVLMATEKWNFLGNLPGDFHYTKGNFSFHFPLMTSVIVSIAATILLNILFRR